MLDDLIRKFSEHADIGHLALAGWAACVSAMLAATFRELAAANRRFDTFMRELAHFNRRFDKEEP